MANPASYLEAELAGLHPYDPRTSAIAIRVDTAAQQIRFRLPIEAARQLADHLAGEIAGYELRKDQSPISSGIGNADGSPDEGQSV